MGVVVPRDLTIPITAIDLMVTFGSTARVRGGDSYFFDKAARRRLHAELGDRAQDVERYLDTYAVVGDDGRIITAAWRTRRLRRS
jgi:hypothetical protein